MNLPAFSSFTRGLNPKKHTTVNTVQMKTIDLQVCLIPIFVWFHRWELSRVHLSPAHRDKAHSAFNVIKLALWMMWRRWQRVIGRHMLIGCQTLVDHRIVSKNRASAEVFLGKSVFLLHFREKFSFPIVFRYLKKVL